MDLKPNKGSSRVWVWNTLADYAEERPKVELLAIRFINAENAQKFKVTFDECKEQVWKKIKTQATMLQGSWIAKIAAHYQIQVAP